MEINQEIKTRSEYIESVIRRYLPAEEGFQKTVLEALNYSILAGGKRLRPMFMLETYRLFCGENMALVEPFMAAIEMIHTYSLVHDDLPAMDDDAYRRGRETTHVVYGEAMGILAGDALLNYAFETAMKSFDNQKELPRAAAALRILAEKSGIYGMIGGQAVDVENNDAPMNRDKLDFIYRLKTGALIEASMMIGAVLAGAVQEEVDKIERCASLIGLAFQIQDDILDVTATMEVLGKPVYSDEKNHKTTYVTLVGIDKAREEAAGISREAAGILKGLPYQNNFLQDLIVTLINREK